MTYLFKMFFSQFSAQLPVRSAASGVVSIVTAVGTLRWTWITDAEAVVKLIISCVGLVTAIAFCIPAIYAAIQTLKNWNKKDN